MRSFLERVAERPWVALIELLVIGSAVYAVLRFLQGTRGARLFQAVLTILIMSFAGVYLIAERFGFDRINVLYPYFIMGVFLVSLVSFQVELRRMLFRLGHVWFLERFFRGDEDTINPVVLAAERLSKKKIGALIAVERSTELGTVVDSGVKLDAIVSTELLETIFWPGSALHDLGVIIRGERIVAAGCQFPLADSDDIDRALGSRHRAALGLSHEVDAVVIVVSEETGSISVAINGDLRRGLTVEAFRKVLLVELMNRSEETDSKELELEATDSKLPKMAGDGTNQAA